MPKKSNKKPDRRYANPGRPPTSPGLQHLLRDVQINLRVNLDEWEAFNERARKAGMSRVDYFVSRCCGKE